MGNRNPMVIMWLILLLVMVFSPVVAMQDEPTEEPPVVEEPVEDVPVEEPAEESDVPLMERLILIFSSLFAGMIGGGGTVLLVVGRFKNEPAMLTLIEGAINSWPPETRELLFRFGTGMRDAGEVVGKVTDGKPNVETTISPPMPTGEIGS